MISTSAQEFWHDLTDEELLRRSRSGYLDEAMQLLAEEELRARGLPMPESGIPQHATSGQDKPDDLVIVSRQLEVTEAQILAGFLKSKDIPAHVGDAEFIRANPYFAYAAGGACLRVPTSFADQARTLINEYSLGQHAAPDAITGEATLPGLQVDDRSLKTYRIYRKPGRPASVVVGEGFSWWALFLGPLWFLANAMWLNFALVTSLYFGGHFYFSARLAHDGASPALWMAFLAYASAWILIGQFANRLLADNLEKRGYQLQGRVQARNPAFARGLAERQQASQHTDGPTQNEQRTAGTTNTP